MKCGVVMPKVFGGDEITETEIMDLVKLAAHDSDAFEALFRQYQPMLNKMIAHYHLSGFDRDDWLQESRAALLRAILTFNGETGSKFGSYFRLVVHSQLNGLVRLNLALKRTIDQKVILLPKAPETQVHESSRTYEDALLMGIELHEFLDQLSAIEAQSFIAEMNGTLYQQPQQVQRARERTRRKLEKYIADYHH
jgi:RNA polymerase sporulation-specific sigma factor